MKTENAFLFGLTNDVFPYILTKVDFNSFKRYGYVTRTSMGEMPGELINEVLNCIEEQPRHKEIIHKYRKLIT